MLYLFAAASLLLPWTTISGQTVPPAPPPDQVALFERIVRAEDSRAPTVADFETLGEGTRSQAAWIRAIAVRALGRLERDSVLPLIRPLLADTDAGVRAVAANAMAQAASRSGAPQARAALIARLAAETDPAVLGLLAESVGRVGPFTAPALAETSDVLARLLDPRAPAAQLHGAVRGTLLFLRGAGARTPIPPALARRLTDIATFGASAAGSDSDSARYIRTVAAAALLSKTADRTTVARVAEDPSEFVREKAVAALASTPDTLFARDLTLRMLRDPAPIVRFRAVTVYARRFRTENCSPLGEGALDTDARVSLAAIDALAQCRSPETDALLDSLAGSLGGAGPEAWHRAARALVSLPASGVHTARGHLPAFERHPNFFVREYAARAARKLGDTAALGRLARDPHPNVVASAIDGLSALIGREADSVYIAALGSDDSHQIMAASRALQGTDRPGVATALFEALDRMTRLQRETARDGRLSLIQRLREVGSAEHAGRLRPLLADFDPVVAGRAAETLAAWTGERPSAAPRVQPQAPVPTFAELATIQNARVRLEMLDGGVIEIGLFSFDAPTNAARFARLAESGYFNGLTLHRVVPAFVVQGGSPNANEYASDARFTRDELGRENRRGTVGLSTRGRDTGDGQFYINLIDNVTLDHNYTVFGEVVAGFDVVDRLQEGATMQRVVLFPAR